MNSIVKPRYFQRGSDGLRAISVVLMMLLIVFEFPYHPPRCCDCCCWPRWSQPCKSFEATERVVRVRFFPNMIMLWSRNGLLLQWWRIIRVKFNSRRRIDWWSHSISMVDFISHDNNVLCCCSNNIRSVCVHYGEQHLQQLAPEHYKRIGTL